MYTTRNTQRLACVNFKQSIKNNIFSFRIIHKTENLKSEIVSTFSLPNQTTEDKISLAYVV